SESHPVRSRVWATDRSRAHCAAPPSTPRSSSRQPCGANVPNWTMRLPPSVDGMAGRCGSGRPEARSLSCHWLRGARGVPRLSIAVEATLPLSHLVASGPLPWIPGPSWVLPSLLSAVWLVPLVLALSTGPGDPADGPLDVLFFALTALFWLGHRVGSTWLPRPPPPAP